VAAGAPRPRSLQPELLLKNFHKRRNFSSSQTSEQKDGRAPAESPAMQDHGSLSFCSFLGADECVIKLHIFTHSFSSF